MLIHTDILAEHFMQKNKWYFTNSNFQNSSFYSLYFSILFNTVFRRRKRKPQYRLSKVPNKIWWNQCIIFHYRSYFIFTYFRNNVSLGKTRWTIVVALKLLKKKKKHKKTKNSHSTTHRPASYYPKGNGIGPVMWLFLGWSPLRISHVCVSYYYYDSFS